MCRRHSSMTTCGGCPSSSSYSSLSHVQWGHPDLITLAIPLFVGFCGGTGDRTRKPLRDTSLPTRPLTNSHSHLDLQRCQHRHQHPKHRGANTDEYTEIHGTYQPHTAEGARVELADALTSRCSRPLGSPMPDLPFFMVSEDVLSTTSDR